MKNKFLLAGLIFLFSLSLSAETYNGTCGAQGNNLTWSLDTETGTLTISGTGAMTDYEYKSPWWYYRTSIKTVIINEGVTSIGKCAFSSCSSLTSVIIPNSVTSIGGGAFSYCSGLTSVTIPNSVTSIGDYAFNNVLNINYNGTATGAPWEARSINGYVDGYLVYSDASKTSLLACSLSTEGEIVIPNSVTSIGGRAFSYCSGLTSVTIPNSVTSIGNSAFSYCSGLTSVTIYSNEIVSKYYSDKSSLSSIFGSQVTEFIIGDGVTRIGISAFSGCSSLTSVIIPNSVTSIGSSAFAYCRGLTSVIIPNSVTSIGSSAFAYCRGLTSVTIPNSVTSIGWSAFSDCSGLTSVTIPNSVTSIGSSAFEGCSSLTSVTIPNSVTSIVGTFSGCSSLTSVTIPNSVTIIGDSTFSGCSGLASIEIPNSVTSIGDYAFSSCSGLTSIEIPNSDTNIGSYAFSDCSSLTSVTIPKSVTSIGNYAFSGCTSLTSVTINSNKIVSKYYSYDSSLISIFGLQVTEFIIGDGVTSIGNYAFYDYTSLASIGIPYSDNRRSRLTSVSIPNSVTSIGNYAFKGCSNLTSVTIPNSVKSIGEYAFKGCSNLTSVTIPNSVKSIGDYAFSYCESLTSVTIPNSVTSIGTRVFEDCSGLTSVTIPSSVTSIGDYAFSGCKIETIYSFMTGILCEIKNTTFGLKNTASETILYVPKNAMSVYSKADIWKEFNIVPMTAEQVETNEEVVKVEPAETTADIVWPIVIGAADYELIIKDQNDDVICTHTFNAQGELTQITYNAPDRNRVPEQTAEQVAGFAFTIIGLNSGITYAYTLYAKDSDGKVIDTKTGSFTTDGKGVATNLEHSKTNADNKQSVKVIRNGNVYILNGSKTYNLQGMEVK